MYHSPKVDGKHFYRLSREQMFALAEESPPPIINVQGVEAGNWLNIEISGSQVCGGFYQIWGGESTDYSNVQTLQFNRRFMPGWKDPFYVDILPNS